MCVCVRERERERESASRRGLPGSDPPEGPDLNGGGVGGFQVPTSFNFHRREPSATWTACSG